MAREQHHLKPVAGERRESPAGPSASAEETKNKNETATATPTPTPTPTDAGVESSTDNAAQQQPEGDTGAAPAVDTAPAAPEATPQATAPAPVPPSAPAPTPTPAAGTVPDERYKRIVLDAAGSKFAYGDETRSGHTVNRVDFIRFAWTTQRQSRGAIAKEVSRLTGKKVTYQIIFAATKGVAGGPPAAAAPMPQPVAPSAPTT